MPILPLRIVFLSVAFDPSMVMRTGAGLDGLGYSIVTTKSPVIAEARSL